VNDGTGCGSDSRDNEASSSGDTVKCTVASLMKAFLRREDDDSGKMWGWSSRW